MKKFDYKLVAKDLRFKGRLINFLLGSYSKKKVILFEKFTSMIFAGRARGKGFTYKQIHLTREDGSKFRVCIYRSKNLTEKAKACVLWIHGGGYAMGEPEQDISFIKEFLQHDCIVIAPDYTKSIIKPFPAGLNDCYQTLIWIKENYSDLNFDSSKIMVGGDSAGGGLAIAICMLARDNNTVNISCQIPIYPMISYIDTESSKENFAPVWNTKSNHFAWQLYLGEDYISGNVSKYASPLLEKDYSKLPRAISYVGDLDPFKDETANYIEELKNANIETHFKMLQGAYHGFDIVSKNSNATKIARNFLRDSIVYAINNYSNPQQ